MEMLVSIEKNECLVFEVGSQDVDKVQAARETQ